MSVQERTKRIGLRNTTDKTLHNKIIQKKNQNQPASQPASQPVPAPSLSYRIVQFMCIPTLSLTHSEFFGFNKCPIKV